MDKDLQADIGKLSKFIRQAKHCVSICEIIDAKHYKFTPSEFMKMYELIEETDAALDRIVARILEPSSKENCIFKNCEWYDENAEGNCNGDCCGGSAQERCEWYKYLQRDREINIQRESKLAHDFDDNRDTSGDWPEDFPGENETEPRTMDDKDSDEFGPINLNDVEPDDVSFLRKPKPTPDFDAIAREIEEEAFDSWRFNKSSKQYEGFFDRSECAEILRKHFGKEELVCLKNT
jgi:hypothetical protein